MSTLGSCKNQIEEPNIEEPNINSSKLNSAFIDTIKDTGIENLALVVNMPDESFLSTIKHLETYGEEDILESFIMIPMYNGTKVQLITLEYEDDNLIPKEIVYEKSASEEGYGLYVRTIRPEGAPHLKLRLEYEGSTAEYIITYNGKEGTPKYEYISQTKERQEEDGDKQEDIYDLEGELITPIQDNDYTEGLNLIDSSICDIDNDANSEMIDVYCQAELDEQGNPMFDDGQEWSIVLRKENKVYPLFERSYIQLGGLSYQAFESFEDNMYHILVIHEESSLMVIYDCIYNPETKELRREKVYEQYNIINYRNSYR